MDHLKVPASNPCGIGEKKPFSIELGEGQPGRSTWYTAKVIDVQPRRENDAIVIHPRKKIRDHMTGWLSVSHPDHTGGGV